MINSYTNTSLAVLTNEALNFNIDSIKTGCTVTHSPGSTTFSLNKPGFYFVTFNGVGAATDTPVGNIIVQLQQNGANVPGALTSAASTTALTDVESLGFSTIIQVKPSCCAVDNNVNLTFVNTGIPTTFSNINVAITKLC